MLSSAASTLWFIPGAVVLTYLSKIPLAVAMRREGRGYDNRLPRSQQARLSGWGQRAHAAHQNSLEVLPVFTACLLTGTMLQGDEGALNVCGAIFVLSRIAYVYLYLADRATLRSLVWGAGMAASLAAACIGLLGRAA